MYSTHSTDSNDVFDFVLVLGTPGEKLARMMKMYENVTFSGEASKGLYFCY